MSIGLQNTSRRNAHVKTRIITIALCGLDVAAWMVIAWLSFMSRSDPATIGLDRTAGMIVTALFLVTGVPAIILTWLNRAPIAALILALAFPAALAAAFIAAVAAFA
jgi:hypothetical protein